MKQAITVIFALACCLLGHSSPAKVFIGEQLDYEIVFHWGIIWKHAASATMSFGQSGQGYSAKLTARTVSWADKLYQVRDTLTCKIRSDLKPLKYVKAAHEHKYFAIDKIDFSHSGGTTTGDCQRIRKDGTTGLQLSSTGPTFDMFSVFYYLRALDYSGMQSGHKETVTIFSGQEKETLTVRYITQEDVKLRDKSVHKSHHITFTFTSEDGKESSTPINVWLSTDAAHIPLLIIGKIRIGEVRCYCRLPK